MHILLFSTALARALVVLMLVPFISSCSSNDDKYNECVLEHTKPGMAIVAVKNVKDSCNGLFLKEGKSREFSFYQKYVFAAAIDILKSFESMKYAVGFEEENKYASGMVNLASTQYDLMRGAPETDIEKINKNGFSLIYIYIIMFLSFFIRFLFVTFKDGLSIQKARKTMINLSLSIVFVIILTSIGSAITSSIAKDTINKYIDSPYNIPIYIDRDGKKFQKAEFDGEKIIHTYKLPMGYDNQEYNNMGLWFSSHANSCANFVSGNTPAFMAAFYANIPIEYIYKTIDNKYATSDIIYPTSCIARKSKR